MQLDMLMAITNRTFFKTMMDIKICINNLIRMENIIKIFMKTTGMRMLGNSI